MAEVRAVLREFGARAAAGGPLSEMAGVAWITVPEKNLEDAVAKLNLLGYTSAVELVSDQGTLKSRDSYHARWKRRSVVLTPVYEESDEILRAEAADLRTFLLECADGVVRAIHGYRGGRGPLEHRGLPVEDARLLVNLVATADTRVLLDPFAGAGGVILAAKARGLATASLDNDPALRLGLAQLGDWHVVADASSMPFATASIDAVATEPPYDASALGSVVASIAEIARVIRPGGRAALLLASAQAGDVQRAAVKAGLTLELNSHVDRKGTEVSCLCWMAANQAA